MDFALPLICGFVVGALITGFLVYNTIYNKMKLEAETWRAKFEAQSTTAEKSKEDSENLKKQVVLQFENLAQKIFEEKSTRFSDQNHKQISTLLDPLKERIKKFEKKVV